MLNPPLLRLKSFWPLYLLIGAGVLLILTARNTVDMDLWGLLAFGRLLTHGPFPYHDVFSYTAPQAEWIYHEWGCGWLFYQVFQLLGSPSLFALKLLILAGIAAMIQATLSLYQEKRAGSISLLFAVMSILALYLFLPLTLATIRCHLFSFLGFALLIYLLERFRLNPGTQAYWWIPATMLLWGNLHGGYITGLLLLAFYAIWFAAERKPAQARTIGLTLLASILAVMINPYAFKLPLALVSGWLHPRPFIGEWQNVFLWSPIYGTVYTVLLLYWLFFGALGWRKEKSRFPGALLLLAATGLMGFLHVKLVPFFLLIMLTYGFSLPLPEKELSIPPRLAQLAQMLLILLSAGLLFLETSIASGSLNVQVPGSRQAGQSVTIYPQGAVAFIQSNHLHGNLWSTFEWGEYLLWNLSPEIKVSLDGRYETLYPEQIFLDHRSFFGPPFDTSQAFRYSTQLLLVPSNLTPLLQKLASDKRLTSLYQDEVATLFTVGNQETPFTGPLQNATVSLDSYKQP